VTASGQFPNTVPPPTSTASITPSKSRHSKSHTKSMTKPVTQTASVTPPPASQSSSKSPGSASSSLSPVSASGSFSFGASQSGSVSVVVQGTQTGTPAPSTAHSPSGVSVSPIGPSKVSLNACVRTTKPRAQLRIAGVCRKYNGVATISASQVCCVGFGLNAWDFRVGGNCVRGTHALAEFCTALGGTAVCASYDPLTNKSTWRCGIP